MYSTQEASTSTVSSSSSLGEPVLGKIVPPPTSPPAKSPWGAKNAPFRRVDLLAIPSLAQLCARVSCISIGPEQRTLQATESRCRAFVKQVPCFCRHSWPPGAQASNFFLSASTLLSFSVNPLSLYINLLSFSPHLQIFLPPFRRRNVAAHMLCAEAGAT